MVPQRIGFRYYSLTNSSFTMNGVQNLLRGTDLHSESEYEGNAVDSPTVSSQFDAIQKVGMNYVRLVHYPHPVFTYNIADERGIGISTETGDWGRRPMSAASPGTGTLAKWFCRISTIPAYYGAGIGE